MRQKLSQQNGFTLVEIMVATSIFMMIMLVAMGALITSSDTSKKSKALRLSMDNVNFAMENMTRSLRMGTHYSCVSAGILSIPTSSANVSDCPNGGDALAFTFAEHDKNFIDTAYKLSLRSDLVTHTLQRCDGSSPCVDLVSSEIDIQKMQFFVNGTNPSDGVQPSAYILVKGSIAIKGGTVPFALQTMVSQRSGE